MYCPKCNKEVTDGSVFCNTCGSRLTNNTSFSTNQNSNTNSVIDIQSLTKAYIGSQYETMRTTEFSIWYLLFGVFYALYRKMYLMGISLIGLASILLWYDPKLCLIVMVIVNIVISIRFNSIYVKHVDQVVENIRKNNHLAREELLRVCRCQGGANIIYPIIALIGIFTLSFYITKGKITNYIPINSQKGYNYQKLVVNNPKEFGSVNDSSGNHIFNYDKSKDSCNYTISVMDSTNNTAYNYLNRKNVYTARDSKSPIETIDINNKSWNLLKVNSSSNALIYDYAIIYKHYLYNVTYKIYKDSGVCTKLKDELIDSLELK